MACPPLGNEWYALCTEYHLLIGVLLLEDFTVIKVMLSAILVGMIGMLLGSYVYAELSGWLARSLEGWGDRGDQTLMDLLRLPPLPVIAGVSLLLLVALVLLRTI